MPDRPDLTPAFDALNRCNAVLADLDARCCDPGRSPRMARLAETLTAVGSSLDGLVGSETPDATVVIGHLEDAGAQLGTLQVTCCAPNRLALYAEMLDGLARIQMRVAAATGLGH